MCVQSLSRVRLCDAMDCGTPGSSVHGIFWARIQPFFDINILWASADKESTCNAGDPSLISGSESFPGEGISYPLQYSWASLVAQTVKNLPAMRGTWVRSLGWEDPPEEGTATHSSLFAWRIPMNRGAWRATVHGVEKSRT